MHAATFKVENSAQGSSCKLKFVMGKVKEVCQNKLSLLLMNSWKLFKHYNYYSLQELHKLHLTLKNTEQSLASDSLEIVKEMF